MSLDYSQIAHWLAVAEERYAAKIPTNESDRSWFERNRRSKNGWPRKFHVRPTVADDHWAFYFGYAKPAGFLTIVAGDAWWRAIVAINEDKFGPPVDDDKYAGWRLDALVREEAEQRKDER
jgi:hypothetical protein